MNGGGRVGENDAKGMDGIETRECVHVDGIGKTSRDDDDDDECDRTCGEMRREICLSLSLSNGGYFFRGCRAGRGV